MYTGMVKTQSPRNTVDSGGPRLILNWMRRILKNSMSRSLAWQTFIDMDEVSLCQTAYFIQILLNILIGQFVVYEVTGEIFIV